MNFVIQINGKKCWEQQVPTLIPEREATSWARINTEVVRRLGTEPPRKMIYHTRGDLILVNVLT